VQSRVRTSFQPRDGDVTTKSRFSAEIHAFLILRPRAGCVTVYAREQATAVIRANEINDLEIFLPGTTRAKCRRDLLGGGFSMPQLVTQTKPGDKTSAVVPSVIPNREKALKILSKSIYKEMRQNGYEPKQIVALATELISLVTSDIKEDSRLD
jgi:hypothetical protein